MVLAWIEFKPTDKNMDWNIIKIKQDICIKSSSISNILSQTSE